MIYFEYLKLTIFTILFVQNNIEFVRASFECVIKNKAHLDEFLYQSSTKSKNEFINGYMGPIEKINELDRAKWTIKLLSNNKITFQNKKTNEYLCAMPPVFYNRFDRLYNSLNKIKASDLNCIWMQKKMMDDDYNENANKTFLIWNSLYSQQLFAHPKSNKHQRPIHLSQDKTKLHMKNNFKWIINCS